MTQTRRENINYDHIAPTANRTAADAPAGLSKADAQVWADGYNAALSNLGDIYVVTWTGGIEEPTFFSTRNVKDAEAKFAEWVADTREHDQIDLLRVTLTGETTVIDTGASRFDNDVAGVCPDCEADLTTNQAADGYCPVCNDPNRVA